LAAEPEVAPEEHRHDPEPTKRATAVKNEVSLGVPTNPCDGFRMIHRKANTPRA